MPLRIQLAPLLGLINGESTVHILFHQPLHPFSLSLISLSSFNSTISNQTKFSSSVLIAHSDHFRFFIPLDLFFDSIWYKVINLINIFINFSAFCYFYLVLVIGFWLSFVKDLFFDIFWEFWEAGCWFKLLCLLIGCLWDFFVGILEIWMCISIFLCLNWNLFFVYKIRILRFLIDWKIILKSDLLIFLLIFFW